MVGREKHEGIPKVGSLVLSRDSPYMLLLLTAPPSLYRLCSLVLEDPPVPRCEP